MLFQHLPITGTSFLIFKLLAKAKSSSPGNQSHHHWLRCVGLFTPTPQKVEGCLQRGFLLLFLELYEGKVVSGFSNWNSDCISSEQSTATDSCPTLGAIYITLSDITDQVNFGELEQKSKWYLPDCFFRRKKSELIH